MRSLVTKMLVANRLLNKTLFSFHSKRFLRFLLAGGINTFFGFAVYSIAILAKASTWQALFIGMLSGTVFNFFSTGGYVFRDLAPIRFPRFLICYLLVYAINLQLLNTFLLFFNNKIISQAIVTAPMALFSYFLISKFVFSPMSSMTQLHNQERIKRQFVTISAFLLLLLCYHLIFGGLFPNFQGKLGGDFSFVLPSLLDGFFWFKNNSLFEVPWFTPSFCGGQPYFADVQSFYYSASQIFTLFFDPLTSAYLSILVFVTLGFWGMYLLLQHIFKVSTETAFLGASLFMFNGFYAERMIVGHLSFQGFMLVPWVALLLLYVAPDNQEKAKFSALVNTTLAGVVVGYWLQSGLTSLIIPVSLAVLAIVCLYFYISGNCWQVFLRRSVGAMMVALALSASKLVAGFAFMANFERSNYLLPGFNGILKTLELLFLTLFFSPANIEQIAIPNITNMQWLLMRHEWEYGITFIPLLIIMLAWIMWLGKPTAFLTNRTAKSLFALGLLIAILVLPIALNIYTPEWNAILKNTPLIKSSSSLIRWWLIYIPIVIIYAAISLENLTFLTKYRIYCVVIGVILIVLLNITKDRINYDTQIYKGDKVLKAYQKKATGHVRPEIHEIGAITDTIFDTKGNNLNRNDDIVFGMSQVACYNPSFGYRLENFPVKSLHPGSIFEQSKGYLNLKNPACYVFPVENHCLPGEHFTVAQKKQAELFARYKPFSFAIPLKQKIANIISLSAVVVITAFLDICVIYCTVRKIYFNQRISGKN
jgi:hypothetical protein